MVAIVYCTNDDMIDLSGWFVMVVCNEKRDREKRSGSVNKIENA
jgi:hypothetical protein